MVPDGERRRRAVRRWNEGFAIGNDRCIGHSGCHRGRDATETFTLSLGRCWVTALSGRNPLVRKSDRVEALMLVLVFATALAVTAVAGAIGTAVHDTHARAYAEQSRDRHSVTATVTGGSHCHV